MYRQVPWRWDLVTSLDGRTIAKIIRPHEDSRTYGIRSQVSEAAIAHAGSSPRSRASSAASMSSVVGEDVRST